MTQARRHHTGTLLQDGTVLVIGGENSDGALVEADVFDPTTRMFNAASDMLEARYKHTATLLPDGTVFVCGGANTSGSLKTCEIYNPADQTFTSAPSMGIGRYDHTATLLPDGKVLITGGKSIDDTSVEIYDYVTGLFADTSTLFMTRGRDGHRAIQPAWSLGKARFNSGNVTVVGSNGDLGLQDTDWTNGGNQVIKSGDIMICLRTNVPYVINTVAANSIDLTTAFSGMSTDEYITGDDTSEVGFEDYVILSQDVYIAGGDVFDQATATEVYDYSTGVFDPASPLVTGPPSYGRYGHTLTSFANMRLLICGGILVSDCEYTTLTNVTGWDQFDDDTWNVNTGLDSGTQAFFPE
jgi:hypothetical protein